MTGKIKTSLIIDEFTSIKYNYWIEGETLFIETKKYEISDEIVMILKDINNKHIVEFGGDGSFELNRIRKIEIL